MPWNVICALQSAWNISVFLLMIEYDIKQKQNKTKN